MPKDTQALSRRFTVENLNCGGCAARAEKALQAVAGVEVAQVNFATRQASVTAEPGLDWAGLSTAMAEAGYPVEPLRPEPETRAVVEDETGPYRRAFLWALLLTLPVFVMEMGGHLIPAFHHWQMSLAPVWVLHGVQFLLTTAVLAGPGRVFFRLGVPSLLKGRPEMNSLVVLGAGAAWIWSSLVTFAPGLVPATGRYVYFEAAAVIVTLILLGRWLEARARGSAGAAIQGLMELRPDTAWRLDGDRAIETPTSKIQPGDLIQLKPGGRVAVDGVVTAGNSFIDEAMLTGEPIPAEKSPGDPVTAGTINGTGALTYRATATGADTTLARIISMVEDAQATRLPVQSLINRVTAIFVPVVLVIALLATAAWMIWGPDPAKAIAIGVSVLIIACPCAMGLATPVSILAGTGRAAELGVLFRQGDALQTLSKVDLIAFDKTGTLTEGRPSVTALTVTRDSDEATLLSVAAGAEAPSEHPLAQAIVAEAEARGLTPLPIDSFESHTGGGVTAKAKGETLRVGSAAFLESQGVSVPEAAADATTQVHVARGALYLGYLSLSDAIKPDAARAVEALQAQGIEIAILSGDAEAPVTAVANTLGITRIHAGLSPADKRARVAGWRESGAKVAFVGDGINDAAVLAEADVGIALGTGTDIAMEAADIVLVSGAPSGVATAHRISLRTLRNIAQNLVWAFGYNIALIPVAAGLLALAGGPFLNPMLAAGAMAASSVLVVSNALRLRRMGAL